MSQGPGLVAGSVPGPILSLLFPPEPADALGGGDRAQVGLQQDCGDTSVCLMKRQVCGPGTSAGRGSGQHGGRAWVTAPGDPECAGPCRAVFSVTSVFQARVWVTGQTSSPEVLQITAPSGDGFLLRTLSSERSGGIYLSPSRARRA